MSFYRFLSCALSKCFQFPRVLLILWFVCQNIHQIPLSIQISCHIRVILLTVYFWFDDIWWRKILFWKLNLKFFFPPVLASFQSSKRINQKQKKKSLFPVQNGMRQTRIFFHVNQFERYILDEGYVKTRRCVCVCVCVERKQVLNIEIYGRDAFVI